MASTYNSPNEDFMTVEESDEFKNPVKISQKKLTIPCSVVTGPYINQVVVYDRLLENRSAVLYNFFLRNVFKKNTDIFSMYMTLPIVLSFVADKSYVENALLQTHNAFSQGIGIKKPEIERDSHIRLSYALLACNEEWNKHTKETDAIVKNISVRCVWNENGIEPFYAETLRSIMFLQQIMGVINRSNFQEGGDSYINASGKVTTINSMADKGCSELDEKNCERGECILRPTSTGGKSCINKERYRTTKPGLKTSYYILDDPYFDNKIVYTFLCTTRIVAGFSGIFQQYDVSKNGSIRSNGKYTIVFPPFGGDTIRDKIGGIMTFYYNGYIANVEAVSSGKAPAMTVGIMIGIAKAIDQWFIECRETIQTIPKDAHIYITGCSLGGALANVAAFRFLQLGYKNVHMYSFGAPRIGDENMSKYMSACNLASDSANYVRINNIIAENGRFYTQFDPVTKFPINTWSLLAASGSHLRFVNNARMRCMEGGLTFNPVLGTFDSQPDYDMLPYERLRRMGYNPNKGTPIGGDCDELFGFIHSIPAYSANNFVGARDYEGDPAEYTNYFDRIINMKNEPCQK